MLPEVFVLGNRKGSNFTTQVLADQLVRDGVPAYPVTPHATPKFKLERVKLIINDGVGGLPDWWQSPPHEVKWLNEPGTVQLSSNKLYMFRELAKMKVPTLRWTDDYGQACLWNDAGKRIVVRHRIAGARGQGIEIIEPCTHMPRARLYTELFTGKFVREYRVYIVNGKPVDVVQKMRRTREHLIERGIDPDDEFKKIVRTHGNGWVFARNSWERKPREMEMVYDVAWHAADVLGMGYGGIDLAVRGWKDRDPDVVVIESNTHIGLDGSTVRNLSQAIKEVYVEVKDD